MVDGGGLPALFFCRAWEAWEAPRPHGPPTCYGAFRQGDGARPVYWTMKCRGFSNFRRHVQVELSSFVGRAEPHNININRHFQLFISHNRPLHGRQRSSLAWGFSQSDSTHMKVASQYSVNRAGSPNIANGSLSEVSTACLHRRSKKKIASVGTYKQRRPEHGFPHYDMQSLRASRSVFLGISCCLLQTARFGSNDSSKDE